MTRNLYAALAALFLALFVGACESNIDETGDTGIPAETLTITVEAILDGNVLDGQPLTIEDTAVIAEGVTGEPIELKLRSDAQVMIGELASDLSTDGYRIHTVDGADYVHRKVTIGTDTTETPISVSLIRYVFGADTDCDFYRNGEYRETRNEGTVETQEGYKLFLHESIGDGSWFEFDGNSVEFVGDKPDNGYTLDYFTVETSSITLGIDGEDGYDELVCSL